MGLAEFYTARPDPNIYNFINTQLLATIWNDVDDTWLSGPWWNGPVRHISCSPTDQVTDIESLLTVERYNCWVSRVLPL